MKINYTYTFENSGIYRGCIRLQRALLFFLGLTSVLISMQVKSYAQSNFADAGIWQAFGSINSSSTQIKGRLISFAWTDIEQQKDNFIWTGFDADIKKRTLGIAGYGSLSVIISLFIYEVGSDASTKIDAPSWLFDEATGLDIPKIKLSINSGAYYIDAPYYYATDYQTRFDIMVKALRDHIANTISSSPDANLVNAFKKIIGIQACYGSTGDFISYKGDPVYPTINENYTCVIKREDGTTEQADLTTQNAKIKNYNPSNPTALNFTELFHIFSSIYQNAYYTAGEPGFGGDQKVRILHNPGNEGSNEDQWLITNCPGTWRKCGSLGHIYQVTDEATRLAFWKTTLSNPQYNSSVTDKYVRGRGEIVGGITAAGWWTGAYLQPVCTTYAHVNRAVAADLPGYPQKNLFTLYASMLHYGVDIANPEAAMLADPKYDSVLLFYNRYAGQKDPVKATNGFCMLRDGLDASDIERFRPEDYGTIGTDAEKASRAYNILNSSINGSTPFKNYGALLEDPCSMVGDEPVNRRSSGINDVAFGILGGNYERYITQVGRDIDNDNIVDPIYKSCNSYWNIISSDDPDSKHAMFGRFGKSIYSINNSTSKASMYFVINDLFLSEYSGNIRFKITYLDKGAGNWSFRYKPLGAATAEILQFVKTNTNSWKEQIIDIDASAFKNKNNCPNNSDFFLYATTTSSSPKETIFALIEIEKAPAQQQRISPTEIKTVTQLSVYPNPANNVLVIVIPEEMKAGQLIISDIYGRTIIRQTGNKSIMRLPISSLASGTYNFSIITNNGQKLNKQFIKQ